ncbi:hemolysin A [Enterococcus ratti]|uniref:Hemolysin A n=2 Tax=Enterococcus ratti TaxID=150033 RepID=A0A1L8WFW3_9ENTE|nr:hemolysin A [Enterococcus ratti]
MRKKMEKERVDVLAVKQGLFETREQAKRSVMAGLIYNEKNERFDKPGEKIPITSKLQIKGKKFPYVSRGGLKLEKALKVFNLSVADKVLLDIGASTGGFTDAALQNGAKMSYALDVGYNQLAWKIRQDKRVIVMERMNFRYAKPEDFQYGQPEIAVIDVSFISLRLMFVPLHEILADGGEVIALIKPQFEAGKEAVGKNGIVRDKHTHVQVIKEILNFVVIHGYDVLDLSYSPITGGEGNIEFLVHLKKVANQGTISASIDSETIVKQAHKQFNPNE